MIHIYVSKDEYNIVMPPFAYYYREKTHFVNEKIPRMINNLYWKKGVIYYDTFLLN